MTRHLQNPPTEQSAAAPIAPTRLRLLSTRLLVSFPAVGLVWWSVEHFLSHPSGLGLFVGSLIFGAGVTWHTLAQATVNRALRPKP